jgi:hypothetical protein
MLGYAPKVSSFEVCLSVCIFADQDLPAEYRDEIPYGDTPRARQLRGQLRMAEAPSNQSSSREATDVVQVSETQRWVVEFDMLFAQYSSLSPGAEQHLLFLRMYALLQKHGGYQALPQATFLKVGPGMIAMFDRELPDPVSLRPLVKVEQVSYPWSDAGKMVQVVSRSLEARRYAPPNRQPPMRSLTGFDLHYNLAPLRRNLPEAVRIRMPERHCSLCAIGGHYPRDCPFRQFGYIMWLFDRDTQTLTRVIPGTCVVVHTDWPTFLICAQPNEIPKLRTCSLDELLKRAQGVPMQASDDPAEWARELTSADGEWLPSVVE